MIAASSQKLRVFVWMYTLRDTQTWSLSFDGSRPLTPSSPPRAAVYRPSLEQDLFCQLRLMVQALAASAEGPEGPECLACLGTNQNEVYGTILVKQKPLKVSSVNRGPTQCLLSVPSSSSQTAS